MCPGSDLPDRSSDPDHRRPVRSGRLCISDSSIRAGRFRFLCDHRYARDSSVSYLYDHLAGSILFLSYIAGYRHKTGPLHVPGAVRRNRSREEDEARQYVRGDSCHGDLRFRALSGRVRQGMASVRRLQPAGGSARVPGCRHLLKET